MSRDYVMGLMKSLKFVAIPKAYDEVLATARKRKQTTETVIELELPRFRGRYSAWVSSSLLIIIFIV